jgi:integrase/recombinase XerD
MSTLRELLEDYLTTRRALGFKLQSEGTGLKTFVSFMERSGADHITVQLALAWAKQPKSVQDTQRARRLGFVRGFARYCSGFDPRTQIPSPALIVHRRVRPQPYFFSSHDIERLLQAALALKEQEGLQRWTYYCLYGLLSVTGLRVGEARALTVDDVDLDEGVLTIRSSKFGKSRLVPLHASTVEILADYLNRRRSAFDEPASQHVFLNARGTPLGYDQALDVFQRLLASIGVGPRADGRRPHLHDLRHRFAMEVLAQWYRDGHDIEQRLPTLSAFLGHTEVRNTYWYLSARPELLDLAQGRLELYWGTQS